MKYSIALIAASTLGSASNLNAQPDADSPDKTAAQPKTQSGYRVVHQEADPRFITSIERVGSCTLPGPPLETAQVRVTEELHPRKSAERHEEGTVRMHYLRF